ncbi:hypothetical protein TYRP_011948 [Tyrophagus putrescentiae]|nr:hypothetical protein TYRP_022372 [Tyrophagus putrescentiae]KAH9408277.1 hypothetical protein TYRP_011948 [Tyrophagus putrescentiae]
MKSIRNLTEYKIGSTTISLMSMSSKTRQLYLENAQQGKYKCLLTDSTVSGTQIQQTYNVVPCGSNDAKIKIIKSDTIVENQTSDVEKSVTKIEDESDLSVTDFKMLCFFMQYQTTNLSANCLTRFIIVPIHFVFTSQDVII